LLLAACGGKKDDKKDETASSLPADARLATSDAATKQPTVTLADLVPKLDDPAKHGRVFCDLPAGSRAVRISSAHLGADRQPGLDERFWHEYYTTGPNWHLAKATHLIVEDVHTSYREKPRATKNWSGWLTTYALPDMSVVCNTSIDRGTALHSLTDPDLALVHELQSADPCALTLDDSGPDPAVCVGRLERLRQAGATAAIEVMRSARAVCSCNGTDCAGLEARHDELVASARANASKLVESSLDLDRRLLYDCVIAKR
jgi:hypothetical protein